MVLFGGVSKFVLCACVYHSPSPRLSFESATHPTHTHTYTHTYTYIHTHTHTYIHTHTHTHTYTHTHIHTYTHIHIHTHTHIHTYIHTHTHTPHKHTHTHTYTPQLLSFLTPPSLPLLTSPTLASHLALNEPVTLKVGFLNTRELRHMLSAGPLPCPWAETRAHCLAFDVVPKARTHCSFDVVTVVLRHLFTKKH